MMLAKERALVLVAFSCSLSLSSLAIAAVETNPVDPESAASLVCSRICLREAPGGQVEWSREEDSGIWNAASVGDCWVIGVGTPIYLRNNGPQLAVVERQTDNGCDGKYEFKGSLSKIKPNSTVCYSPGVLRVIGGGVLGGIQRIAEGVGFLGKQLSWLVPFLKKTSGPLETASVVSAPETVGDFGSMRVDYRSGSVSGSHAFGYVAADFLLGTQDVGDSLVVDAQLNVDGTFTYTLLAKTAGASATSTIGEPVSLDCVGDFVTYSADGSIVSRSICPSEATEAVEASSCTGILAAPNPAGSSRIRFEYNLSTGGHVNLAVFDVRGRLVRRLFDGNREAGTYSEAWDRRSTSGVLAKAGTYYYVMTHRGIRRSGSIVLLAP